MAAITRKSLYFTDSYEVSLREERLPPPAANQVVVETVVSAISAGTEMLVYRGQVPTRLAVDETIGALAGEFAFPLKYGYAAVGRVMVIGAEVERSWLDRMVFAFNPHESHFLAAPADLIPVKGAISPENAVFLPNMETAVSFVMDGQPTIGEQVVVFGQGIVGLLTTSLLSELPLARLITLDGYPLRREQSLKLGAHVSLDPTAPDLLADLRTLLPETLPYGGADLSYELSGNPKALEQAIAITTFNGRVVIGSWYGTKTVELDLGGLFHRSHMQLISSQVSHLNPRWRGRWNKARRMRVAWRMIEKHQPASLITHRLPLTQAAHAYQLLDQSPKQAIQVVLTYD
ncbi:MAG: zinc-dependent alcohol dehydrogenase [Ardenticatenaceae bacterium]